MRMLLIAALFVTLILALGAQTFFGAEAPPKKPAPAPSGGAEKPAADKQRLPTMEDLHEIYGAGEYRICLQQVARALAVRGEAARQYDKHTLLLLRGDCLLRLEDPESAENAYEAAQKSVDSAIASEARAMALVIEKRNPAKLTYSPKPAPGADDPQPIDFSDPKNRQAAVTALFRDTFAAAKPRIDKSLDAKTLVPLIDIQPTMQDLYALERTGTGGDVEVRPILLKMGELARTLIVRELDDIELETTSLQQLANQSAGVEVGGWWGGGGRRGLHTPERRQLRDRISYLSKITETADRCRQLSVAYGGDGATWLPLIDRADRMEFYAQNVLDAE